MPHTKNFFKGFGSASVHAGHQPDPLHAHLVPIYASSTFVFDTAEQGMQRFSGAEEGYIYSRWGNPTFTEAEQKIAALETFGLDMEAKGLLHASGMAAITTLMLGTLKPGDKVLTHSALYGGTEELMLKILEPLGIGTVVSDLKEPSATEAIIKGDSRIKMLYVETPSNPTIQCVDIEMLTTLAHQYNLIVACDNTFATPYLQLPFKYGVDFIMHSTTKFLNGHGTAIGGILIGRDLERMNGPITKVHRLLGGNSNPFDAFLLSNGLKTLELRMERHCSNAEKVAKFLDQHAGVQKVNYNGLATHPDHELTKKQMRHAGAMLSFEVVDGLQGGIDFMNKLQMCVRAVSLGTCDTLLSHPASMTHYGVAKEQREKYGITDGLIRMNVGIENAEDIISDLQQALEG